MSELNSRQWKMYRFIKKRSLDGLYTNYNDVLDNEELSTIYRNMCSTVEAMRSYIKNDIHAIRDTNNPEIKVIIGSGPKGYKIPSDEQEVIDWLDRRYKTIFKSLKLANHCKNKAGLNGQYRFVNEDSEAKECIEAFIKSNKERRVLNGTNN